MLWSHIFQYFSKSMKDTMRTTTENNDQTSRLRETKLTTAAADGIVEVPPTSKGGIKSLIEGTIYNIAGTITGPTTISVTNLLKRPANLEGADSSNRA